MRAHVSKRRYASPLIYWPWLLVGVSWIIAILATLTGQRTLVDHHFLIEESGLPWLLAAAVFLCGWQVMIAAMMVPTSIPFMLAHVPPTRLHGDRARAVVTVATCYLGYALVWTMFGVFAFVGDTLIHRLVDAWPWLAAHTFLIGATTLAIAGLFQFTRKKRLRLTRCREWAPGPADGCIASWSDACRIGIRHGIDSIGCCWALMLIMFGLGVGNLGWMAALTGVMVAETRMPNDVASGRTRYAIGVGLMALACLWLAHPSWLVPATVS